MRSELYASVEGHHKHLAPQHTGCQVLLQMRPALMQELGQKDDAQLGNIGTQHTGKCVILLCSTIVLVGHRPPG